MDFYFCEGCGKRITDGDIKQGKGKNKKLRGVYCRQCAAGVMTLETLPLTDSKSQKVLKEEPTVESTPQKRLSRHSTRIGQAVPPSNHNSVILGGVIAAAVTIVLLAMATGGDKNRRRPRSVRAPTSPDPAPPGHSNKLAATAEAPSATATRTLPKADYREPFVEPKAPHFIQPPRESEIPSASPLPAPPPPTLENPVQEQHLEDAVSTSAEKSIQPSQQDPANLNAMVPRKMRPDERKAFASKLEALLHAIQSHDFLKAEDLARKSASDPELGVAQLAAKHFLPAVAILQARKQALEAVLKKRVGQKISVRTTKREFNGMLQRFEGGRLEIQSSGTINGRMVPGPGFIVSASDLHPDTLAKLSPFEPTTPDQYMATVLAAMATGHLEDAQAALSGLGSPSVAGPLRGWILAQNKKVLEEQASASWSILASKCKAATNAQTAEALTSEADAFLETYGTTRFARDNREAIDRINERLLQLTVHAADALKEIFCGKIQEFNATSRHIRISYDLTLPLTRMDFQFYKQSRRSDGVKRMDGGLWFHGSGKPGALWPIMLSFHYIDRSHLELQFRFHNRSTNPHWQAGLVVGKSLPLLVQWSPKGAAIQPFMAKRKDEYQSTPPLAAKTFSMGTEPIRVLLTLKAEKLEVIFKNKVLNERLEANMPRNARGNRVAWGGVGPTKYLVDQLTIQGKLSPQWVEQAKKAMKDPNYKR